MSKIRKIVFYFLFFICQLCFFGAILLVSFYNNPANNITYTTPLSFELILKALGRTNFSVIRATFDLETTLFLIFFLMSSLFALFVFIKTATKAKSRLRFWTFAIQPAIFWWGWLGLLALPFDIYSGTRGELAGEWLGEGLPIIEALGVWIICSVYVVIISFDKKEIKNFIRR